MARLALFCVVLLLAVGSAQGALSIKDLLANIKQLVTMKLQPILTCIMQAFQTLSTTHTCNWSTSNTQIKPNAFPAIGAVLTSVFSNLTCTQSNPNNYKQCGNGWLYDGSWCFCKGTIQCSASAATTTAATTTKATTTQATTKATTQPTTQPTTVATTQAATTSAPAKTTLPPPTTPTISAITPANGLQLSIAGRQTVQITLTASGNPQPAVTVSNGIYTFTLSSLPAGVANTYLYTGALPPVDITMVGTWTITVSNGIGQPAISTFIVAVNSQSYTVNSGPDVAPQLIPVPVSGLVALQAYACEHLLLSFAPAVFSNDAYITYQYPSLNFDAGSSTFVDSYYYMQYPDVEPYPAACPRTGEPADTTPFWLLINASQIGTTLTVDVWSSPSGVYQTLQNATDVASFTIRNLGYDVKQVVFDNLSTSPLNVINYPTAV